jgi:hypothetical protein
LFGWLRHCPTAKQISKGERGGIWSIDMKLAGSEWQFQHWFGASVTLVIIFVTSVCSRKETKQTE